MSRAMSETVTYVRLEDLTYGEPVDAELVAELLELELVPYRRAPEGPYEIADESCEDMRTMLRLSTVLGVNPAGVACIMHMRGRMREMRRELVRLRQAERAALARMRG